MSDDLVIVSPYIKIRDKDVALISSTHTPRFYDFTEEEFVYFSGRGRDNYNKCIYPYIGEKYEPYVKKDILRWWIKKISFVSPITINMMNNFPNVGKLDQSYIKNYSVYFYSGIFSIGKRIYDIEKEIVYYVYKDRYTERKMTLSDFMKNYTNKNILVSIIANLGKIPKNKKYEISLVEFLIERIYSLEKRDIIYFRDCLNNMMVDIKKDKKVFCPITFLNRELNKTKDE